MSEKEEMSIAKKMLISLAAAFIVGGIFMYLHERLADTSNEYIWEQLNAIFFQDITEPEASGLGIFYVIGTIFMDALRLTIVPLVFTSIILAMSSMTDLKKLGRIAYKTVMIFLLMDIIGGLFAGATGLLTRKLGWISVGSSITGEPSDITEVDSANPLSVITEMVPQNIFDAFSDNNNVLAVVFIAIVLGISTGILGERLKIFKKLMEDINELIQLFISFLLYKVGPVGIFSLIVRAFALYGFEQIQPVLIYVVVAIVILIIYLLIGVSSIFALATKLNPIILMKKMIKVVLIAFSTAASSPALPLNLKTNTDELGVSEGVANFVLPLGMTINMTGTTMMHVIGTFFIATVSGYHVTIPDIFMIILLSGVAAAGTPAVPATGTVLLFTVLSGMGYANETATIIYSLILAINKPVEMVLTMLNVMGDAVAAVIVSNSEKELNTDIYYDRKKNVS